MKKYKNDQSYTYNYYYNAKMKLYIKKNKKVLNQAQRQMQK